MPAKETIYRGYRFRSRLEARWAVYFQTMGGLWEYEPQGFDLGSFGSYLPDFWLGHHVGALADDGWGWWVEVKPNLASEEERDKLLALCVETNHNGLILQGAPWRCVISKIQVMHVEKPYIIQKVHPFWIWIGTLNEEGKANEEVNEERWHRAAQAARNAQQARFEHGELPRDWF